jgi:Serine/threonine protein kinase
MGLLVGTRLGRYEIRSHVGTGGMGEVYCARDPELNRNVAIKILPESFLQNRERLLRFQQEAQATGALNHPNILAVYDVGTHDNTPYIVAELLEGETLRELVTRKRLPQQKAVEYALQIVRGLAAAHEKGIVHRDLKPENIFVTKDERVKILDFGLAKLTETSDWLTESDTPTRLVTKAGVIVGTTAYMSPEQVRGLPVDERSDIFSLGAVLFEMLTGTRAFKGDTNIETLNAILRDEPPPLSQIDSRTSPALERIVRHCMEKSPELRFQSARDLAFDLENLSESDSSPLASVAPAHLPSIKRIIWIAMSMLLLIVFVLLVYYYRHSQSEAKAVRFSIEMPEKTSFAGFSNISPDGRWVALRGTNAAGQVMYFLRSLDSRDARPLPGTEGAAFCFWSADSRSLGFAIESKILKIDVAGGPPQVVSENTGRPASGGGSWSPIGVILFSTREGIFRVADSGGEPQLVITIDKNQGEQALMFPSFLPDGRHFLYLVVGEQSGGMEYVGSLESHEGKRLGNTDMAAAYSAPGYLLYVRGGTLLAQPFDVDRLELSGKPMEVAREVTTGIPYSYAPYSVSQTDVLVYQSKSPMETQLTWVDRSGKELQRVGSPGVISEPVLSPDQKRVAFGRRDKQYKRDIWVLDLDRGNPLRLTTGDGDNAQQVWSPDGTMIVFDRRLGGGRTNVYEKDANGGGEERLLLEGNQTFPDAWSPDGRYISYIKYDPKTQWDEWLLPTFGDRKPAPYIQTPFNEGSSVFSPDGKWVAFYSNESGKVESYIQSFPSPGSKVQISNGGGGEVRWRSDGKELFYIGLDQELMSVDIKVEGNKLTCSLPRPLFKTDVTPLRDMRNHYDVSSDGQRFLFAIPTQKASAATVNVVMNWTADLK